MNRTDRLLAIVLELQGKGRQRTEVHYLQNSIVFVAGTPDTPESKHRVTLLQQLRRAIIQRSTVRFSTTPAMRERAGASRRPARPIPMA